MSAAVAGGGDGRRGRPSTRRSPRLARELPAATARPRRVLLRARRRGARARTPSRPRRRRVDRRARRPEHARELAVRERVGHAAADADRRRRRRAGGRDAARRPQPRSARGGVHRGHRDPARARRAAGARLRGARRRRESSPTELDVWMPEPGGHPARRAGGAPGRDSDGQSGPGSRASRPPSGTRPLWRASATRSGSECNRAERTGGLSFRQCPRPGSTSRSSTSTLLRRREEAPEHLPEVRVALSRRRARGGALGLRPLRPPLPDARAGADRLVRRPGLVRRGGSRRPLGRPARLLRPAALRRAARRGGAEHRPRRGDGDRAGDDRRPSGRARGDGLHVHGRLDGERGRREVLASLRLGDRARRAADRRSPRRAARGCRRGSSR